MLRDKNIRTLNDLLDAAARRRGRGTALAALDRRYSYRRLRRLVLAAAAGLREGGVRRGERVAIMHRNGMPFIVTYFALARLGAVAVPINFMVTKPAELAFMLNDCRAVAAVIEAEFLPQLLAAAPAVASLRRLWVSGAPPACGARGGPETRAFAELLKCDWRRGPQAAARESDTAAILYTSGTTGIPKGVMLTHRNLVTNCTAAAAHMKLRRSDVALCILPMFHTFAWTANVLARMRVGIKFAVAPSVTPAKPWLNLMVRHGVTIFTAVPPLFAVLAKESVGLKRIVLRWWFFRKVRLAISGAAPLPPAVQRVFEQALHVPIYEGYGLTETSPIAAINPPGLRKPGTAGVPIQGVRIKTVDEQGRTLPPGRDGEICIRGDCVMKGYHNRPEDTRAAFTRDGWLRTGDVGSIDADGYLTIKDRLKDMIIVKGLKVYPAAVEAVLLEHAAVAEAAVIGVPDGRGDETVKAFVVLRPQARAERSALLRHCRERLDGYKRPRDVEIVPALPKNTLQKVLKGELRRQELARRAAPR
ncbi:MAG: long-chain-fatty-acid--CoA ligase [Elusimicrobia bacterium]|nr:long-chain-fatty-acid--CoA ligase [Elusimicrobiota bacterium]